MDLKDEVSGKGVGARAPRAEGRVLLRWGAGVQTTQTENQMAPA